MPRELVILGVAFFAAVNLLEAHRKRPQLKHSKVFMMALTVSMVVAIINSFAVIYRLWFVSDIELCHSFGFKLVLERINLVVAHVVVAACLIGAAIGVISVVAHLFLPQATYQRLFGWIDRTEKRHVQ